MKNLTDVLSQAGIRVLYEELSDRLAEWNDCPPTEKECQAVSVLEATLDWLQPFVNNLRTELVPIYQAEHDITFIMEDKWLRDELLSRELVGWYCGEPNADETELYANRQYKSDIRI